jgi:hypothetical protein
MTDLVILRLLPTKPMAAGDFTTLLTGLEIKAFDLSFAHSEHGVLQHAALQSLSHGLTALRAVSPGQHPAEISRQRCLDELGECVLVCKLRFDDPFFRRFLAA